MNESLAFQEKAKKLIPGMTQLLSKRPDQFAPGIWPGYYKKAKGASVWDLDGRHYIDMSISGIGANVLGYADDDVDEAVINAIQNGVSASLNCTQEVELAEKLTTLHPWADQARFSRGGGEVMAMAVRIARAHTKRSVVAFCGYHGWHDWYLAANLDNESALDGHLLPGLDPAGVPKELVGTAIPFSFNDVTSLQNIAKRFGDRLAAIVMEPIRNTPPSQDFIDTIQAIRNKTGAVLIVDEISAGFRLTPGGAHLLYALKPDMASFSKALGNGYPISALIGTKSVISAAESCFISSTNWTERCGPTAALATIEKFEKNKVHTHLVLCGQKIKQGWQKAADAAGLNIVVSGIDPMAHFRFEHPSPMEMKAYFVQLLLEKGYLASTLYYAMWAHTHEHIQGYLDGVQDAFLKIRNALDEGSLKNQLKGDPARTGFLRLN